MLCFYGGVAVLDLDSHNEVPDPGNLRPKTHPLHSPLLVLLIPRF